jgi:hypothetical protein
MPHLEPTYLRYIYDGLLKGSIHPENAAELPEGLIGLYEEAFDERTSVVERQKLLQRFAIWALLKKEVSASFVAEILGETEDEIQEFISTYSAWFNSPESGKYQLYHERLKVYLLQKLSEGEVYDLYVKIINRLEQAIEEKQADEFELYGLEFIGVHFYTIAESKLFEISLKKIFQDRQLLILGDFQAIHENLDLALLAAKRREDREIILKVSAERLRIRKRLYDNLDLIYISIENNNCQTMSNLVGHFVGKEKGFITLLLLYEFFEGRFSTHESKIIFINLLMDQLSSIEDDLNVRGWTLPVPMSAQELYSDELKKLDLDDFHFRKLFELKSNNDDEFDFNFNYDFDETDSPNYFDLDENDLSDLESDSSLIDDSDDAEFSTSDSTDNSFEILTEEEKEQLQEFLRSVEDKNIDPEILHEIKDNDENLNVTFDVKKSHLIHELIRSENKIEDLEKYSVKLFKNRNSFASFNSETSLQLLIPLKDVVPMHEFGNMYNFIIQDLKTRKVQNNPIVFSHEIDACCRLLIENKLFHEALELMDLSAQSEMRENIIDLALESSYTFDKDLYLDVLNSILKRNKIETSIHVNKGALMRDYILNDNLQDLNYMLSGDKFFKAIICGTVLDDEQLLNKILSGEKSLNYWISLFEQTISLELKPFAVLFRIYFNWKYNSNGFSEIDKEIFKEQITNVEGIEGLKKLLHCLKLFTINEECVLLTLEQINAIVERDEMFISEFIPNEDIQILMFKCLLIALKDLTNISKESLSPLFYKIYSLTKNATIIERTACAWILNKDLVIMESMKGEKSIAPEIPLILLKYGYEVESFEIFQLLDNSLTKIEKFKFWAEVLKRGNKQDDAIRILMEIVTNDFETLSDEFSFEHQSFSYIPLTADLLNKLFASSSINDFKLVSAKLLDHVESLAISQNEKRKILSDFTFNIDFNAFKTLLSTVNEDQKQLLAGSLSYFKKYHDKIQDKIYEELCIIGQDMELVESALIHLVKCDLFYTNTFESLNETEDLFDFEYWLSLKSPN